VPDLHGWITQQIDKTQRIAEAARGQGEGRWHHETGYHSGRVEDERGETVVYDEGAPLEEEAAHIAFHDPAAVLRRCAVDRKILTEHQPQPDGSDFPDSMQCSTCSKDGGDGYQYLVPAPCPTLRALAEAYGWTKEQP
jgi:hypothetical protein